MLGSKECMSLHAPGSNPECKGIIVGCKSVNLRSKPEMSLSTVLTTIPCDSIVDIIDKGQGEWLIATWQGKTGYIFSNYVRDVT